MKGEGGEGGDYTYNSTASLRCFNTEHPDARGLRVLTNGGPLQKTTGRNTQPYLL